MVLMRTLFGVALLGLAVTGCPTQCRCPDTADNLIFEMHCNNASLTQVPSGELQEALFIDLSFNNITTLKNNTFFAKQILKLVRLYLNNNNLKTIEENAFRGLTQLKLLNLERNGIRVLLPNTFEDNIELEVLNLNGNQGLQLPDTGLHLPNLDILLLKNCGLKTIPTDFFKNTLNLQYIFLTGNELEVFDTQLIAPLTQLKQLDLRNNKFTSLQLDLHETFPDTLVVHFDGNPLHCDCELESTYTLNKKKKLYDFLTCGFPTNSSLHKFLLDSCPNTTLASLVSRTTTSQSVHPTTLLETTSSTSAYTTTSQASSQVIAPEDEAVDSSDRTDAQLEMDGYTGWIALSALVLALIIVVVITVLVRRRNKARDYVTPRRFTLLGYDEEEQCYVT